MSAIEIQRIQAAIFSIQKEVRELSGKSGAAPAVSADDVQKEVQSAYVRMMVSVDSSLAEIRTRLDELERKAAIPAPVAPVAEVDLSEVLARIEKVEAVPKMAKATEILARLDKIESVLAEKSSA